MKFGPVPVEDALGAILAHSVMAGSKRLRKGLVLDRPSIALLAEAGLASVIAAVLEPGDVGENEAAEALGKAIGDKAVRAAEASTGRVNIHAAHAGLFRADRAAVDAFNAIDPAITFACLADRSSVTAGDMVATIKIIPLAVSGPSLDNALAVIATPGFIRVAGYKPMRAGLVATRLATLKPSVMDKTRDLTAARLSASGSRLVEEVRVAHASGAVASEIRRLAAELDLVIVFGASAVADSADVIPQAIGEAGGTVERVGMPVDPGNLLVLGSVNGKPVIGAPGCARSPKENGFDWVLSRILTGETPSSMDIASLGVGGLLGEIPTRPQPRSGAVARKAAGGVGIVLLAAGRSSRMGDAGGHKLLALFDGAPLIRRMALAALGSSTTETIVVTGHRSEEIETALEGLDLKCVANPAYETGMASSLKCGLAALSPGSAGAMVLLGDMPAVTTGHLDRLIAAFAEGGADCIVRACDGARRGNPVILPRTAFAALNQIDGDMGARAIIERGSHRVIDVDIGPAARLDVDTADAVRKAGGVIEVIDAGRSDGQASPRGAKGRSRGQ